MSKRMSEFQYENHAASNPHAPPFSLARRNAAKQAIAQAVKSIDDESADLKVAASYLAAAISLLVDE